MAFLAAAAAMAAAKQMPLHTAVSGIFGSISMAAWLCVILPQMITNYRNKSAEALSVPFLIVWMLGDITNLIGGLLTHLAPTAIALAIYFCIADIMLITQTLYYNSLNARLAEEAIAGRGEATEDEPLLARRNTSPSRESNKLDPTEEELPESSPMVQNFLSLLAVYAAGFMGWFISYKAGVWEGAEPDAINPNATMTPAESIGMVLGYISSICYLFARLPQIYKNFQEKSCEGLAILFFLLSLTGNLTYAISILAYSQEQKYLINTIPWVIGSLGTVFEDAIIFVQFRLYAKNKRGDAINA